MPGTAGIMAIALTPALQVSRPVPSPTISHACCSGRTGVVPHRVLRLPFCSVQVAAVVSSTFYSIWNLFSGFLIPQVSSCMSLVWMMHPRSGRPVALTCKAPPCLMFLNHHWPNKTAAVHAHKQHRSLAVLSAKMTRSSWNFTDFHGFHRCPCPGGGFGIRKP